MGQPSDLQLGEANNAAIWLLSMMCVWIYLDLLLRFLDGVAIEVPGGQTAETSDTRSSGVGTFDAKINNATPFLI